MRKKYIPCRIAAKTMTSAQLREGFLIGDLFAAGEITLYYTDCDRAVVGSACPISEPLALSSADELRADYFCQRRELGVLNIGGAGAVKVDGESHALASLETLYIGRGSRDVSFSSDSPDSPAEFYLLSYPAHKGYPTVKSAAGGAQTLSLGEASKANVRTINQVVCQDRIASAQLVMGFTRLADGSVWNTMPAHTHERRSEVYMYFDILADESVFHFMGSPDETRHIVVRNKDVVLSPSWSIHSGCGTRNYSFCWGMGGENQRFDDMDAVSAEELK